MKVKGIIIPFSHHSQLRPSVGMRFNWLLFLQIGGETLATEPEWFCENKHQLVYVKNNQEDIAFANGSMIKDKNGLGVYIKLPYCPSTINNVEMDNLLSAESYDEEEKSTATYTGVLQDGKGKTLYCKWGRTKYVSITNVVEWNTASIPSKCNLAKNMFNL